MKTYEQGRASALAELHPQWLAEKERADRAEARIAELEAQIAAKPAGTDKLREAFEVAWPEIYKAGNDHGWRGIAWASWQSCAASTALQAPVREVPETAIPALVAALQDCLDYGSMTGSEWVADQAREAIKQATGGAK